MALNFQTQIATPEGIIVDNAYGRVAVANGAKGDVVEFQVQVFASEAAFTAGAKSFDPQDMNTYGSVAYDYTTGEKDILDLAHDMLIQSLADQGFVATKSL